MSGLTHGSNRLCFCDDRTGFSIVTVNRQPSCKSPFSGTENVINDCFDINIHYIHRDK